MMTKIKSFMKDEKGQGMTEYGLVLGLIAVAVVGLLALFRNEVVEIFDNALTNLRSRETQPEPVVTNTQ